jgi:hypothetical protein
MGITSRWGRKYTLSERDFAQQRENKLMDLNVQLIVISLAKHFSVVARL